MAYYFDGGTKAPDGTGWLLKIMLMQDFYERKPTGLFVMGSSPLDGPFDGWEIPRSFVWALPEDQDRRALSP